MLSFDPSTSSLFSRFNNLVASRGGNSAQSLSQVSVQTQTKSGLSIVTAEGDTVTLSTNTAYQGTGVRYNARGVAEGQALTLRSNSLESELISQKQITIEGDLNEQEIQDIQKVIKQVNGLTKDVKSGNVQAALVHGQQISASGTIASIDLKIQHAESIKVSQAFEQRGGGNAGRAGQPVAPNGESATTLVSPQDNALQGLLASKFLSKPEQEQHERSGRVSHREEGLRRSGSEEPDESFTQKVKNSVKDGVEGLVEFFNKVGEELLRGAEAIAKLADRLKNKVEKQAEKIARVYERLGEALAAGKTDKAERLQDKLDRRVDRLENTVDKFSSRINKVANKLVDKLTNLLGDRVDQVEATEPIQSEEAGGAVPSTEAVPSSSTGIGDQTLSA